jgi:hypothetical protein
MKDNSRTTNDLYLAETTILYKSSSSGYYYGRNKNSKPKAQPKLYHPNKDKAESITVNTN